QRGHPGVDRTGTHTVDGHAARDELDGEAAGEPGQSVLRSRVRRDPRGRAHAFGRCDVHDATLAVAHEMRQAGANESSLTAEVDVEGRLPRRLIVLTVDRS